MKKIFKRSQIPILLIIISLVIGLAPLASVLLASFIAEIGNCTLNEATVNSCKIGNFELGGLLSQMFIAGWFMLLSLPLGLVGLILGIILLSNQINKNQRK